MTTYYGQFYDDGLMRLGVDTRIVGSCVDRKRVSNIFGPISAIHCDTGKSITIVRIDS